MNVSTGAASSVTLFLPGNKVSESHRGLSYGKPNYRRDLTDRPTTGSFFEGAITAGYSTDATDAALQADVVAAGYTGLGW